MSHYSWVNILKMVFVVTLASLLSSCHGPLHTCLTTCTPPEARDLFCGCSWEVPSERPIIPPPPMWTRPNIYQHLKSTPNCFSNHEMFIFNPNDQDIQAEVTWRVRNSIQRDSKWVDVGKQMTTIDKAPSLGMQRLEPDCFDRDFILRQWRFTKTKVDGDLQNLSTAKGLSLESAKIDQEVRQARSAVPLNCKQICDPSEPSAACLFLEPPKVDLIERARENVLNAMDSGDIDWNIVLAPILGETGGCKRTEVLRGEGVITNQGETCAYPFKLNPSDSKPMAVIHIPPVLKFDTKAAKSDRKIKSSSIYESPYIGFRNQSYTEAYGGHIQEVTVDDHSLYYKTDAPACIEIRTR